MRIAESYFQEPIKTLKDLLLGNTYSVVSVGDWWSLALSSGHWLVAQEIKSSFDSELRSLLSGSSQPILDAVDPEDIPTAVAVLRNRRREITDVTLEADGALHLSFDQNWKLCLSTDTDIVDWHWCVNETGGSPYSNLLVACFEPGSVQIGTDPPIQLNR